LEFKIKQTFSLFGFWRAFWTADLILEEKKKEEEEEEEEEEAMAN
jgi:hypothetical protein